MQPAVAHIMVVSNLIIDSTLVPTSYPNPSIVELPVQQNNSCFEPKELGSSYQDDSVTLPALLVLQHPRVHHYLILISVDDRTRVNCRDAVQVHRVGANSCNTFHILRL
mmetsp:Transcript_22717/g.35566  ORF Transcript_22717/g.35566 Transcript_22717/m.35566 type:complete len:109 (+) Transcript_22717:82-408(+)